MTAVVDNRTGVLLRSLSMVVSKAESFAVPLFLDGDSALSGVGVMVGLEPIGAVDGPVRGALPSKVDVSGSAWSRRGGEVGSLSVGGAVWVYAIRSSDAAAISPGGLLARLWFDPLPVGEYILMPRGMLSATIASPDFLMWRQIPIHFLSGTVLVV